MANLNDTITDGSAKFKVVKSATSSDVSDHNNLATAHSNGISGNADTATKLNFYIIKNNKEYDENHYFKLAEGWTKRNWNNINLKLLVTNNGNGYGVWVIRINADGTGKNLGVVDNSIVGNVGLDVSNFILAYKNDSDSSLKFELWVKIPVRYGVLMFTVLHTSLYDSLSDSISSITFYNRVGSDGQSSITTGFTALTTTNATIKGDIEGNASTATNASKVNNHTVESNVPVNAKFTDTTYSNFVKSGSTAAAGLVPAPSTTAGTTKYLREDGTWQVPPDNNTTYTAMSASEATTGTATTARTITAKVLADYVAGKVSAVVNSAPATLDTLKELADALGSDANFATTMTNALANKLDKTATASTATKLATARTVDGVSFDGSANITHYGSCSTAAATVAKTVACTGFTLATGAEINVKFTVTNTAANPTLNVNSTGAKAIYYRGAAINAGYLAANRTYRFVYNGTQYELIGDIDTNSTGYLSTGGGTLTGEVSIKNTGVANKGTKPSAIQYRQLVFTSNDGTAVTNRLGILENMVDTNGVTGTYMAAYKFASGDSSSGRIAIFNNNGTVYTEAPTPATADNSTKIATTAFVKAQGYITASGNAATATKLATARTINIQDSTATNTGTGASFDGSGNATIKLPATIKASITGNCSGSSGSCTGNAATATKLATARTINIQDSSATNTGTGASFDGSGNATIKLPTTIKANITGNVTGNCSGSSGSCTGNAATATKATGDKNGKDIAATYLPLAGGTMTGALITQHTFKIQNKNIDWANNPTPSSSLFDSLYFTDKNGTSLGTLEAYQSTNGRHGVKINVPSGPTNPSWQSCQMEYDENGRFKFSSNNIDTFCVNNVFDGYDLVNGYIPTSNKYSSHIWRDAKGQAVLEFLGFVNQEGWGASRGILFRTYGSDGQINQTSILSIGIDKNAKPVVNINTPDTNSTSDNQVATIGWVKNFLRSKNLIS